MNTTDKLENFIDKFQDYLALNSDDEIDITTDDDKVISDMFEYLKYANCNGTDISVFSYNALFKLGFKINSRVLLRRFVNEKLEDLILDSENLQDVVIPNSVTSIGDSAFSYCYGLSSVVIPSSVTSIGNNAFYNCYGLSSVVIPSSVTSIGSMAFSYCYGLSSVVIPSSVTSIGNSAFSQCSKLQKIYCDNTKIATNLKQEYKHIEIICNNKEVKESLHKYPACFNFYKKLYSKINQYFSGETAIDCIIFGCNDDEWSVCFSDSDKDSSHVAVYNEGVLLAKKTVEVTKADALEDTFVWILDLLFKEYHFVEDTIDYVSDGSETSYFANKFQDLREPDEDKLDFLERYTKNKDELRLSKILENIFKDMSDDPDINNLYCLPFNYIKLAFKGREDEFIKAYYTGLKDYINVVYKEKLRQIEEADE